MRSIACFILLLSLAMHSYGQTPKKAETVSLNGIQLYYEVYGAGEPLLLLHGWTQTSQSWIEHIADYALHFEVYAVDLRGHGRTTPLSEDFSIKKAAEDILALIHHLNLEKVKAIGLSFGGIALLELTHLHPEKIASMVLIGTAYQYSGQDNQAENQAFQFENLPPEFIEQLRRQHHGGETQIKALFDPKVAYEVRLSKDDLHRIRVKTLIISGDHDTVAGTNTAFELHQHLPSSYLWIVPHGDHTPIYGPQKADFIRLTTAFLKDEW